MHGRLYRAQILIEQRQRKTLAQIARQEGRSISDVARELIRLGRNARHTVVKWPCSPLGSTGDNLNVNAQASVDEYIFA